MNSNLESSKCPNCGGGTSYSIEEQNIVCKFCGSTFAVDTEKGFGSAESSVPPHEDTKKAQKKQHSFFDSENLVSYKCPDCGGNIITSKETIATFCTFCHNTSIAVDKVSDQRRPDVVIPFSITKEQALEQMLEECKKRKFLPREFINLIESSEIAGVYLPYWLFDASVSANMVMQDHVIRRDYQHFHDHYYEYTTTDTYHINASNRVQYQGVPCIGVSQIPNELSHGIFPYDFSAKQNFKTDYLMGFYAESYNTPAEDYVEDLKTITENKTQDILEAHLSSEGSRTISKNAKLGGFVHQYALLPAWVLSSEYKGKTYSFLINGQTGKSAGNLPISKKIQFTMWLRNTALVAAGMSLLYWLILTT